MAQNTAVSVDKCEDARTPRRAKMKQSGYLDHSGLFRKKPGRREIIINPGGRSAPRTPVTEEQRSALERRRRLERQQEEAELAQVIGEVWDKSY
jgi:hypothetical protein